MILTWCDTDAIRTKLNGENGFISDDLSRITVTPTAQRLENCNKNNITYCDDNALQWSRCESDTYWNEEGMAVISEESEMNLLSVSY